MRECKREGRESFLQLEMRESKEEERKQHQFFTFYGYIFMLFGCDILRLMRVFKTFYIKLIEFFNNF